MADGHVATPEAAAEEALETLREMGVDLRECAILDRDDEVLAATSDAEWSTRARELWEAAGGRPGPAPVQLHVATEAGEVFAVRSPAGPSVIAVSPRFALESLMFCDLRAILRDLEPESAAAA